MHMMHEALDVPFLFVEEEELVWLARKYPAPPLQTPGLARDGLPGGGGRRSPSDGLPGRGGRLQGYASKENTCQATFALMRCQCVSSTTNVIEDPKER